MPFCHNCGNALEQPGAFCSACGTPVESGVAPAKRPALRSVIQESFEGLGRVIRFALYAILLLILFVIWTSWRNDDSKPSTSEGAPLAIESPATHQASAESVRPATHRIGEDFSVGYWAYRCNGATWQGMIPSLGRAEIPDAAFLVVDLYIRDNDRTASTLPPFKLIDSLGREYDESSKGTFMPGVFDTLKQLNPGVSSRGYVIFDVPHGQYSLRVSGGFESGEHALVDLSPQPQNNDASNQPSSTSVQPTNAEKHDVPTQTVEKGQTPDQVKAALGKPDKIVTTGTQMIYVYNDLAKVTFLNGRVSDVE
jgi:Domain of unknown function (DUF4352)